MSERARLNLGEETQPVIADVSDTPLEALFAADDSVLARSIRLLLENDSKGDYYAAHSTST
jgi:hypothetical protein